MLKQKLFFNNRRLLPWGSLLSTLAYQRTPREGLAVNILLVIPPYVLGEGNRAVLPNKAMLPVGPLILAGQLQQRGHQVEVLDLVFEEEWWQALPKSAPDVLLLSCHTIRNVPCCAVVLAELVKLWGFRPHTVLGGNICFDIGIADFASSGLVVDAVVRGFAHGVDVLQVIESRVKGDIEPDKKLITGELPVPALDLLPPAVHVQYLRASAGRYPIYAFGLGCLWSCSYCSAKGRLKWTPRNGLGSVVVQISMAEKLGYGEMWCVDNLLFTDLKATTQFDLEVARRKMQWSGMTRAELVCDLPESFLGRLTALREVAMGVESVSPQTLKVLQRGKLQDYRQTLLQAFGRVSAGGIVSNAFVILDLPGGSEKDLWQLYEFLCSIHPGTISWSFYNPPAQQVVDGRIQPADMGFYRWPLGFSAVVPERVVQWAQLLSGQWWDGWIPNITDSFFEDSKMFGVNFLEGRIAQEKLAKSSAGDVWKAWKKGRRQL